MALDTGPGGDGERPPTLEECAENLCEFVDSFLFALTDHDQPHQDHFRARVESWVQETRAALERKRRG